MILIARALRLAAERGIAAHQDLKPDNVFFDDLARRGIPKWSQGMHFRVYVADFGLADAFRDFGRNQGSRPYMAPEQFERDPVDPAISTEFDVFALAVIACECFLDGMHPSGVITRDHWPWHRGMPQKWNRESTWRKWAEYNEKSLPDADRFPSDIRDLLLSSLSVDPTRRPSLEIFEGTVWQVLESRDPKTADGLRMQVAHLEKGMASSDANDWPHMDRLVMELREFYSDYC